MAVFFVCAIALAYCYRNAAQRNEDGNVLNVRGYKNDDIKNNRRVARGTACKYARAMAFASCGAVGIFSFFI
jgi:hypothetical protein